MVGCAEEVSRVEGMLAEEVSRVEGMFAEEVFRVEGMFGQSANISVGAALSSSSDRLMGPANSLSKTP